MSIIIKGLSVPQDCTDCACTNYFGGCLLVAKLKPDVSIEEYDDEWHKAHKEHRRMKYCPIVDPTEYEQAMIEEILSEKEFPRAKAHDEPIHVTFNNDGTASAQIPIDKVDLAFKVGLLKFGEDKNGSQQD